MRNHILDSPVCYYAIYAVARFLPMKICRSIGRFIALIVYVFSTKDRKGIAYNLSLALEKSPRDGSIKKIIRNIFANYGEYMADFFFLPVPSVAS